MCSRESVRIHEDCAARHHRAARSAVVEERFRTAVDLPEVIANSNDTIVGAMLFR